MKLLTAEIERALPKLYSQENNPDPTVVVKFFCPWSGWTWYATEGEKRGGDWLFFGLVKGFETELGYFSLKELESVSGPGGLKIERDLHWKPTPLSKVKGGKVS